MVDKLLTNAAEHVRDGGEIRVGLEQRGQEAVLSVEDEGDVLPRQKSRLFDAFVSLGKGRSDAKASNLGLGLFVVKVVAESFGGRVTAQDLVGSTGARLVVRLPVLVDAETSRPSG